ARVPAHDPDGRDPHRGARLPRRHRGRGAAAHGARHADALGLRGAGRFVAAARLGLLPRDGRPVGERFVGGGDAGQRIFVLRGRGLHGGARGLLAQPRVGGDHRHHPVDLAVAPGRVGPRRGGGSCGGDPVGSVVCCAAAIGGDNMQDLKAGHLLGATPYRQQFMQFLGVLAAALVLAPVLDLLLEAYGMGVATEERPRPLKAPQATLMAAVARGVFTGDLPWPIIAVGAALAVEIIVVDRTLEARQSPVRVPVLTVAVGVYLPFELSVPILLGGLVAEVARRSWRRPRAATGTTSEPVEERGA